MFNEFFMLDELENYLRARGLSKQERDVILKSAQRELYQVVDNVMGKAYETAITAGVEKRSSEFIQELRPRPGAFELTTDSGQTDFSTPPRPMLYDLLKNAKPLKDGSGVYKIIPVGRESKRPPVSANIFDAQKRQLAEQAEKLKTRANRGASNVSFRTVTSKQNSATQWVYPAQDKDFTQTLKEVNEDMSTTLEEQAKAIIDKYMEAN